MPVSLKLAEPLVEGVKAKLIANMAARVSAINGDTQIPALRQPLKAPKDDSYYTSGLSIMPPEQPSIVVAEGPMSINPDELSGPHELATTTEIRVFILEADPDRQQLGKRLTRQARAVIESVWDADPAERINGLDGGTLSWRIVPFRTEPGPVYDPDQEVSFFRAWYLVSFLAEQIEG